MIKKYFINQKEKRLRAGWRLLLFLLAVPVTMRVLDMILRPLFGNLLHINAVKWTFRGIMVVLGVTFLVWIWRKCIDKKSLISLGLKINSIAWWDMVMGFLLSVLMTGLFFITLLIVGFLEINEISWHSENLVSGAEIVLLLFGIGLATGYSEELGFRGYILQNMEEGIGLRWAVLVSCILYGAMHMANPNSTILSGLLIMGFGFLRIFGWLRTGQLWLSIGMHAGWNFFQGPIFGFSISGLESNHLIKHTLKGPTWLTGGEFGPEASLFIIPILILALFLMYLWSRKREDIPWERV